MKEFLYNNIDINRQPPTQEPDRQYYFIEKCRRYIEKKKEKLGRPLFAAIQTFGCQMNARDSEKMQGILEQIGFAIIEKENADLVIYNTCTVRENANLKVYGRLGNLKKLKSKNPNMKIILCGCMMQEDIVVEKIQKSYRFVDIIFGTYNIFKLAELLYTSFQTDEMIIDIWKESSQIVEDLPSERKYSFKSGINIMYGCNNFCSYCIVPYVRGRERSRNPQEILEEIKTLSEDKVVEIMLLGQNVNSYGKTLSTPFSFPQLLKEIEKIEKIKRIRFMTSHPKDLSDSLIEVMKDSDKICRHLHLPVQSGSSKILKKMNRNYTKEHYLTLVEKIKEAIPNIGLTTDIIVGFPGETEEDFQETLDLVEKVQFNSAYTFLYSKRTNTPAAVMEDQVPEEIAKERFQRLLTKVQKISFEITQKEVGTIQEVLIEEQNEQIKGFLTGRLSNNLLVHFPGNIKEIGKIEKVRLKEGKGFYYIGERAE